MKIFLFLSSVFRERQQREMVFTACARKPTRIVPKTGPTNTTRLLR